MSRLYTHLKQFKHILCLGAHCDDIEIGCGGTLLTILEQQSDIRLSWVVFTSTEKRKVEAERGANLFGANASNIDIRIFDYRDGFLPYTQGAIKDSFEELKKNLVPPDLIFTHYRYDLHQDHRLVSELTWNTFRNNLILEYEIPKWDGDFGNPNTFVPINERLGKIKIEYLQQAYNSQQKKKWFSDDLFWSLMRLRGMECNAKDNFAEAFYSRKLQLEFDV